MVSNQKKNTESFEDWVSITGQYWNDFSKIWGAKNESINYSSLGEKAFKKLNETWELTLKSWTEAGKNLMNPDTSILSEESMAERSEMMEKIIRSMAESFKSFQDSTLKQAENLKANFSDLEFDKIDREMFKKWQEFYQKELGSIFGMPQVGLGREYQERMAGALDKFSLFNAALTEFIYFLYLPMEKTFLLMQKDMENMISEGKMPENSEAYYKEWLKKLEQHYMTMFHSSEYVSVMARTLQSMAEFKSARDLVLEDVIGNMPVTTKSEMDAIYKEIADLKRKVKKLEKEKK